jgi:ribosomal protein S18 acetylase RimI-like enzyme|tara:strand:- start:213 stop:671 length:459 start_codon:yes stop_codon:yes gene_type:complete
MATKIIQIQKKYLDLFSKTFGNGDYFDSINEAKEHFNSKLSEKRLYLLFDDDNNLVGFFDYLFQYSHNANYLYNIAVSSKFRKKGYSNYLLSKYIEVSKNEKTNNPFALSSTHTTNKISQKMHLGFGFKEIGILKGLHFGREDEIFYAYYFN